MCSKHVLSNVCAGLLLLYIASFILRVACFNMLLFSGSKNNYYLLIFCLNICLQICKTALYHMFALVLICFNSTVSYTS